MLQRVYRGYRPRHRRVKAHSSRGKRNPAHRLAPPAGSPTPRRKRHVIQPLFLVRATSAENSTWLPKWEPRPRELADSSDDAPIVVRLAQGTYFDYPALHSLVNERFIAASRGSSVQQSPTVLAR